ncbi:MAG: hypothetical protein JO044_03775 [Mycobacteriaceae bacterium]|nr:hypothetical protein [Mycobacteriaceae bacterium]MBV9640176.1 hypothetical protein [Mycobacteriaceae bacterium]
MIVWVIAALLGVATGLRIGWALVNKQSVVSAAMMLALGSLAVVAALNWQPLTLLIDTVARWPNISIAFSQVALTLCAAASCVMILTVASARKPAVTRRLAWAHYGVALVIAAISVVLFFADGQQPEMAPQMYLLRNLRSHTSLPWLLPLLYVLFALSVVSWAGVRYSNRSRRGRALFLFTMGIGLIVLASGFFLLRAVGTTRFVGVGSAITLLACAMVVVAAGSLLPTVEDWFGARRELRAIDPLLRELVRRQPEVGIGVRPRGPLAFRVAERMSLISDALFLEASAAARASDPTADVAAEAAPVAPQDQARRIAQWIYDSGSHGYGQTPFPGLGWLRQPQAYSDREWILEIAVQYRRLGRERRPQLRPDPAELRRMPG